jgi:N-hydroxyarylamine O-acetyltransferase
MEAGGFTGDHTIEAMLDVSAYLNRIGYAGPTEPTAETLRALHRAHMLAVPFENLDIHLGRPILCDEAAFLHKIVDERRGGFCYELNGAFAALLRALGFCVALLSARVSRADGGESPEFDHLALQVHPRVDLPATVPADVQAEVPDEDSWLADVGFGDSFVEPLLLQPNLEQPQIGRTFRLSESETEIGNVFQLETLAEGSSANDNSPGGWKRQYSFTLKPRQLPDFAAMCRYHQTSPESHFTQQRICSLATRQGRITLSDWKLIERRDGRREERELTALDPSREDRWRATLKESFAIVLPD